MFVYVLVYKNRAILAEKEKVQVKDSLEEGYKKGRVFEYDNNNRENTPGYTPARK